MMSKSRLWFLPQVHHLFFLLLFAAVLLVGAEMLNLDGDLPRHLLMGKYILENQVIPRTELFIHPYLNQPYVPHEWLTDVLFYVVYAKAGWAGLVALAALLLAATFTFVYKNRSDRLQLRLPILLLILWGAIATSLNWAIRPHLVSMFLLALWLTWADDLHRGKRITVWRFPLVMLVWSNLHGEFIAGILVLAAYAAGWLLEFLLDRESADLRTGQPLWLALVLSAFASLLNPSGAGPWQSILGFVNNSYLMSRMVEANSPNFQDPNMRILFSLFAGSIVLLAINRSRLSMGQGLLLAGFSAMSLMAIRNIHLYGIVAPFVLAETLPWLRSLPLVSRLDSVFQTMEDRSKEVVWAPTLVLALSLAILLNIRLPGFYQLHEPAFPVQAASWLREHPQQGNMFNDLNWGGYLGMQLWPGNLTFIDSMADTDGSVTREYEAVSTLQDGWQSILDRHNVNWAILPPQGQLAKALTALGWETVYQDRTAVILVRR